MTQCHKLICFYLCDYLGLQVQKAVKFMCVQGGISVYCFNHEGGMISLEFLTSKLKLNCLNHSYALSQNPESLMLPNCTEVALIALMVSASS